MAGASDEQVHRIAEMSTAGERSNGSQPPPGTPLPPAALVFSFPAHQRALHSAVATRLDKGWKTPGLLGADVVQLHQEAVQRAVAGTSKGI